MKKVVLILAVLMLVTTSISFAEGQTGQLASLGLLNGILQVDTDNAKPTKPSVAILFINNAKTTYDGELGDRLMHVVNNRLGNFTVTVTGAAAIERLAKAGVSDPTIADRTDIVAAFGDADYVVWLELQPVTLTKWGAVLSEGVAATVSVPLRIVDVKNIKYLFAARFSETADNKASLTNLVVPVSMVGTKAAAFAALEKVDAKLDAALGKYLPKELPATAPTSETDKI